MSCTEDLDHVEGPFTWATWFILTDSQTLIHIHLTSEFTWTLPINYWIITALVLFCPFQATLTYSQRHKSFFCSHLFFILVSKYVDEVWTSNFKKTYRVLVRITQYSFVIHSLKPLVVSTIEANITFPSMSACSHNFILFQPFPASLIFRFFVHEFAEIRIGNRKEERWVSTVIRHVQ